MPGFANAAIFGIACALAKKDALPFTKSLKATGYSGSIKLGVEDKTSTAWGLDFLQSSRIETDPSPCDDQLLIQAKKGARVKLTSLNQRRWVYYRKWLDEGSYDRVWLLDVRAVVFQAHPFAFASSAEVGLFMERSEPNGFQQQKLGRCLGRRTAQQMHDARAPSISAGLVAGSAQGIRALCDSMIALAEDAVARGSSCAVGDTYLLTYYAFNRTASLAAGAPLDSGDANATVFERFQGPGLDLDSKRVCEELKGKKRRDARGLVTGLDGRPVALLHKWERCKETARLVSKGLLFAEKTTRSPPAVAGPTPTAAPVAVAPAAEASDADAEEPEPFGLAEAEDGDGPEGERTDRGTKGEAAEEEGAPPPDDEGSMPEAEEEAQPEWQAPPGMHGAAKPRGEAAGASGLDHEAEENLKRLADAQARARAVVEAKKVELAELVKGASIEGMPQLLALFGGSCAVFAACVSCCAKSCCGAGTPTATEHPRRARPREYDRYDDDHDDHWQGRRRAYRG